MSKIELLYDHYKQTRDNLKKIENKRNRYFVFLLVAIITLLLFSFCPHLIIKTMSIWTDVDVANLWLPSINLLQSLMWLINIYILITYIQLNINIEKTYPSIHRIEKELSTKISKYIDNEGDNYLNNYPAVQYVIYWFYAFIFPILMLATAVAKWIIEAYSSIERVYLIADTIFALLFATLSFLYLIFRIKNSHQSKKHAKVHLFSLPSHAKIKIKKRGGQNGRNRKNRPKQSRLEK